MTYLLPRKDLDKAKAVGQEMSELTGLFIEDNVYSKMILRDVNNYIAVYDDYTPENNHVKYKGAFEIDKECHKDSSMRIVPIAVANYFLNNIKIEDTIYNHKNIFDFCLRLKTNSSTTPIFKHIVNNEIVDTILSRTTRYYVSTSPEAGILLKDFGDNRISGINVGNSVQLFNKYVEKDFKDYQVDYNFYIAEAYKLKNAVDDGQLSLF